GRGPRGRAPAARIRRRGVDQRSGDQCRRRLGHPPVSILAPSSRLVGTRIARKEDPRLITGAGRYVDDVVVPDVAHVAFARSEIARGRIVGVDVTEARRAPDVLAVLTAAELNPLRVGRMAATVVIGMTEPGPECVLASDELCYVGDPYAMVVATSRALAEDAIDRIELEVEALPPVIDYDTAIANPELVHGAFRDSNLA